MNEELKTKEYLQSLQQVTLSDSSRARIKDDLLAYARFHAVPEPIATPSPFFSFLSRPAFAAFALLLVVGATTVALNQSGSPELALLDTPSEEGVESTTSTDSVQPTTETNPPTATSATTATPQPSAAAPKSTDSLAMHARTKSAPDTESLDEAFVASDADMSTMLSQGTWSIEDHAADVVLRETILRDLIKKYDAQLQAAVKTEFTTKLDTVADLRVKAEGKSEVDARPSLDAASALIGEVEATLSTLGQVIVEDGIIIDIDFSVDLSQPHQAGEGVTEDSQ